MFNKRKGLPLLPPVNIHYYHYCMNTQLWNRSFKMLKIISEVVYLFCNLRRRKWCILSPKSDPLAWAVIWVPYDDDDRIVWHTNFLQGQHFLRMRHFVWFLNLFTRSIFKFREIINAWIIPLKMFLFHFRFLKGRNILENMEKY